eukprot:SAG22_NODE_252_length_13679_cov_74.486524_8_plen_64_part_00
MIDIQLVPASMHTAVDSMGYRPLLCSTLLPGGRVRARTRPRAPRAGAGPARRNAPENKRTELY